MTHTHVFVRKCVCVCVCVVVYVAKGKADKKGSKKHAHSTAEEWEKLQASNQVRPAFKVKKNADLVCVCVCVRKTLIPPLRATSTFGAE